MSRVFSTLLLGKGWPSFRLLVPLSSGKGASSLSFLPDLGYSPIVGSMTPLLLMPFSFAERSTNLRHLLERLNKMPYDCKDMTKDRLLSHFGLSPRVVPLREPLGITVVFITTFFIYPWYVSYLGSLSLFVYANGIMFSKLLRDEHRAATTPPTAKSSCGTPSSSN
ncbi:UNVERIFIED_CONTAM: hypothetical protein Sradi_4007700 [Sesamum radiatum]|uniref:Uncharacterized protein n=1 Tax=Sesamum radiatum TaxID=300843 RepID=A0AAW2PKK3_SESRA